MQSRGKWVLFMLLVVLMTPAAFAADITITQLSDVVVAEGDGGARFYVFLDKALPKGDTLTMTFETVSGNATSGKDFEAVKGSITITHSDGTSKLLAMVPVMKDRESEDAEIFALKIIDSKLSGGHNLVMADDDSQGIATVVDKAFWKQPAAPLQVQ